MAASGERRMAGERLPDFFIAGHAKSGTTALYFMLRQHPQLHMPVKEPRFFAPELRTRYWRPASTRRQRPRTLEDYARLFAGAGGEQLVGEATPSYLRSAQAPGLIAQVAPNARIIAILREPTSFLRSFHLQSVRNFDETETDFAKAMALERERREGRRVPRFSQAPAGLLYSEHVRYAEQLRRFHAAFGRDQVLVLIYDDFRADNDGTVRRVLRFLEVDDQVPIARVELETLRGVRSPALDQLTRAATIGRRLALQRGGRLATAVEAKPQALTRAAQALSRRWHDFVYVDPPRPDEAFMAELRSRFRGEVEAVSEYLGRDLVTLWGYDDVR